MTATPKLKTQFRFALILGLSLTAAAPGCATMKSPGEWFTKDASAASIPTDGGFTQSLANTGKGITGQFKSMGTAMTSAVGKAKNAVTNTFTARPTDEDPTSLATMPQNLGPEIWVANGQLFETQNNYAKAMDNYTKALEAEPANVSALLSIARLYEKQGNHRESAEFFGKALAVQPDAGIFNELAMSQKTSGSLAEAQATIKKAIELDPSNVRYRNNLADLLVAGGRSDEAVQQLEQVFPPAVANYNVAYMHFSNQNIAAAQQHLKLALQADPNLQQARDLMDRLGGNQTVQTAMAAYGTASQIYRTAETAVQQQVSANTVPYNPGSVNMPSTGYQQPAAQPPAASQGLLPQQFAPPGGYKTPMTGGVNLTGGMPQISTPYATSGQPGMPQISQSQPAGSQPSYPSTGGTSSQSSTGTYPSYPAYPATGGQ